MHITFKQIVMTVIAVAMLVALTGCGIERQYASSDVSPSSSETSPSPSSETPSPDTSASAAPSSPSGATPSATPGNLVAYNGIVENLFFHPIIAYPELAFDGDNKEKGIDEYMVTVSEYQKMLASIYANNYILVNMNDVWREVTEADGTTHMVRNTLMIPEGKKPLMLTYDDVNYYNYMLKNGFTYKLVLKDGEIWSYGLDPEGKPVYSQDLDAITILDKFVKQHPDFSLNGAKGCLCLTGYEGILGYRTMTDTHGMTPEAEAARQKEIEAVKPVIAKLKENGWYFGSHTWGHIDLSTASLDVVKADTNRWMNEVGALIGPTKLFFYPFGARPDGGDVTKTGPVFQFLQSQGFRVFASVGSSSYSKIKSDIDAVICDRMHADGDTLRTQRDRYLKFYDAKLVFDFNYRPNYGTKWQ